MYQRESYSCSDLCADSNSINFHWFLLISQGSLGWPSLPIPAPRGRAHDTERTDEGLPGARKGAGFDQLGMVFVGKIGRKNRGIIELIEGNILTGNAKKPLFFLIKYIGVSGFNFTLNPSNEAMVGERGRARENKRVLQKSPEAQVRHDLGLDLRIFKEKDFRKCQEKSTMNPPTHRAIFPSGPRCHDQKLCRGARPESWGFC